MSEGKISLQFNLANVFQPLTFQYIRRFDYTFGELQRMSQLSDANTGASTSIRALCQLKKNATQALAKKKKMNDPFVCACACAYACVEAVFMVK